MSVSPIGRVPVASVRREVADIDPLLDLARPEGQLDQNEVAHSGRAPYLDPVDAITEDFLKSCKVKSPDPSADSLLLHQLINERLWEKVATASKDPQACDGYSKTFVLSSRFESLFRLKQYDDLVSELASVIPEYSIDGHSSVEQMDGYVSFSLLLAEAKLMSGRSNDAFELWHDLLSWLRPLSVSGRANFWTWHVNCHICNGHIRLRNWKSALRLLRHQTLELDGLFTGCKNEEERSDILGCKVVLLSRAARACCQIGAIRAAHAHYDQACKVLAGNPTLGADSYLQAHMLLLQGLLAFSEEKVRATFIAFSVVTNRWVGAQFEVAIDTFVTLIDAERLRLSGVVTRAEVAAEMAALFSDDSMFKSVRRVLWRPLDDCPLSAAVNNFAVCCLYLKKTTSAIVKIEELIALEPAAYMTDPIIFNLCTMYDLCFAPDISTNKKKALQKIAARFQIADSMLHWRSFRLC